jgi:putative FmdB family regulatory protein
MPIYEYRCAGCGATTTVLTLRVSEEVSPTCTRCGGTDLSRLMSRFAMLRSDDDRLDDLTDDATGLDDDDPRAAARWMRSMGKELGDDAGGDFEEMVDELEQGTPDDDGADAEGGDES